ncbi:MAG: SRPBCC domain-containing protein [Chitinophagaceae bacterium]|nr:MAG: SRPBCC domain-containing protein [Chitinophagaceae bacterium]
MDGKSFSMGFTVKQSADEVFAAVNNVTGWWTENLEGNSDHLRAEFSVRFGTVHYSRQRITAFEQGKKISWLIIDSKLSFVADQQEWNGTTIHFDIDTIEDKTELRFTHEGLLPDIECYNGCSNAWGGYIRDSLKRLIETGKGTPALKAEPIVG